MSTTASQCPQCQVIPLEQLHESKHNPRRHFDGPAMEELVASIRELGILTPLLVRPNKNGFEIAAGHRRYRAAKVAALATVPCLVREMTDLQFMEILNIENLQREDVHPLDEAGGYEALMAAPYKMKVEVLAQKVGKSVKYVYDRIKLLALTKPARDLFWSGRIDAGHAILLARLTPVEQARVIGNGNKDVQYSDGGLFQSCRGLYDDEGGYDDSQVKAVSVRELQAWIDRHIRFTGKHVDPMLFPETVAQITNATEMKRKIIEITHEYLADDDVRQADKAKVYGERAWTRADGQEDSKVCDYAVLGVIASGPGRGQAFDVCVRKDKCLVHWGKEIRAREKRVKERESGNTAAVSKADTAAANDRQRRNDEYERLQRKRKDWEKCTPAVLKAIDARLPSLSAKATGPLGDLLLKAFADWGRAKTSVPRGKTAEDLVRHLAGLYLCRVANDYDAFEKFPKLAKYLGVDLRAILTPEPKGEQAKKAKAA